MGNVGGGGHLVYGVVGDIANTASRVEGLNKYLGTRLLATEEVIDGLDDLLLRRTGSFVFKGKEDALSVFEIMGFEKTATDSTLTLCDRFKAALDVFDVGDWPRAAALFDALHSDFPNDGPTKIYLDLCAKYRVEPPADGEGRIIKLETK